jgi:hypothetical protein
MPQIGDRARAPLPSRIDEPGGIAREQIVRREHVDARVEPRARVRAAMAREEQRQRDDGRDGEAL